MFLDGIARPEIRCRSFFLGWKTCAGGKNEAQKHESGQEGSGLFSNHRYLYVPPIQFQRFPPLYQFSIKAHIYCNRELLAPS